MRYLLCRYVFFELLKVFLVTLTGMTVLIIIALGAKEAVRQGLGAVAILKLIPYILPESLRFSIPATSLFAACSVYGRMSGANEIVAVKSLGITPMVMIWPAFALGFLLSISSVWVNDLAVSWGAVGVKRVILESVEQIAYSALRKDHAYSTSSFSIFIQGVDGQRLLNPVVEISGVGTIEAREARLESNFENDTLVISLTDYTIESNSSIPEIYTDFDTYEYEIPLLEAVKKPSRKKKASDFALHQIPDQITERRQQLVQFQQQAAARVMFDFISGDFHDSSGDDWKKREAEIEWVELRLAQLRTEPWRRWANAFSCMFFVMIGAPLAIRLRNSDTTTSFFVCFFPILLVYYPLLAYGTSQAKTGELPPYFVWLGNVLCLVAGAYVVRRVIRY